MGSKGNLYGTTDCGESAAVGTVFELSPNESGRWREKVLYTFTHSADGGHPSGLILDAAGNLYGATSGHNTDGPVYELSPSANGKWTFTVLCDFTGGDDGAVPSGPSVRDARGNGCIRRCEWVGRRFRNCTVDRFQPSHRTVTMVTDLPLSFHYADFAHIGATSVES
jgi:hypothetical protein